MFCHLVRAFHVQHNDLCGHHRLVFLFDADEHTGDFGGVKEFIAQCEKPDALVIGYPGSEAICTGARGFYRVELNVFGLSAHSGCSTQASQNAAVKAAELVTALSNARLPAETDADFAIGPKLTVTGIEGGKGFSMVPDKFVVRVDLRLTPSFTQAHAVELIENTVRQVDAAKPMSRPTAIDAKESSGSVANICPEKLRRVMRRVS